MKITNGKLAALIIALVIVIDQAVKIWVKTHFYYGEEVMVTSWFRLLFIENNGMAFGMELGSKLLLTLFRIVASAAFIYYLWRLRNTKDYPRGYVVCIALITAGALGNVIDCCFYGLVFDESTRTQIATMFPEVGGYGRFLYGKVVDMFYFPICEWTWPSWVPLVGGGHGEFFNAIFNVADSSVCVGVALLIIDQVFISQNKNNENTEPNSEEISAETEV